jgi:hypothetical protein
MTDSQDKEDEDMKKMGLTEKEKTMRRAKTGSDNDSGEGLQPAARWQEITLRNGEDASDIFVNPEEVERLNDGDVFYRRKDVKALIRKRINTMHEVENNREKERAEKANRVRHELEDLLEELEQ